MNQNIMNQTQVNKQDIALVFTTKKGLHEFLTVEMEFFLPPLHYTSIDWIRDIWQGKKRVSLQLYMIMIIRINLNSLNYIKLLNSSFSQ